jgi:SAM-dependent methyltransferase
VIGSSSEAFRARYRGEHGWPCYGLDIDIQRHPEIVGDAHHLPFADGAFNSVSCDAVLEHVPEPQQVVEEMYRVLKPGGGVVMYVPFLYPYHASPDDYYRFTETGIRYLCRNFAEITIRPCEGYAGTTMRFLFLFAAPWDRWAAKLGDCLIGKLIECGYRFARWVVGRPADAQKVFDYIWRFNPTGFEVVLRKAVAGEQVGGEAVLQQWQRAGR